MSRPKAGKPWLARPDGRTQPGIEDLDLPICGSTSLEPTKANRLGTAAVKTASVASQIMLRRKKGARIRHLSPDKILT